MRFTAKTTIERIKNFLETNTQTQVSNNNNMKFVQPENSDSNLKQQELRVMAAK